MKQLVSFVLLALGAAGLLAAQTPPAVSTLTGTLELRDGRFFLKSGSAVYYVRGLEQYAGSIAGLQDGAQAVLEGSVSSREGMAEQIIFPVKLTLNGKAYDTAPVPGAGGNLDNRTGNPPAGRGSPR